MTAFLFGLFLSSCATTYTLKAEEKSGLDVRIDLPDGIADRIILRVNNPESTWMKVNWNDARIVQMNGFAIPVNVAPSNPIGTIPPYSTVEYHLLPGHDYFPENRNGARRVGVVDRLVYDDEFNRIADTGVSPTIRLHLPVCASDTCDGENPWSMTEIRGAVQRRTQ
jgi:hypothetical protein